MAQRGNPGYGKSVAVREGVEKLTPRWFAEIEELLNSSIDDSVNDNIKELVQALIPTDTHAAKEIIKYLARGAVDDKKFALSELGKLMGKMLPTEITGEGGNALMITWQQPNSSQSHMNQENGNSSSITPESDGLSSSSTGEQEKQQQSSTTSSETQPSPQTPDTLS
jgi:hypothetical protein